MTNETERGVLTDPRRFFDVALPALAARNASTFESLRGQVVFAIAGVGAWTVHLGDLERPVVEGAVAEPALTLFFTEQAFGLLLQQQLDFDQAIERRAVGYEGDLSLLEKLGFLLSSGANADGVQLDQVPRSMKRV